MRFPLATLLLFLAMALPAPAGEVLKATLSGPDKFKAGQPVSVDFKIENVSGNPVTFLRWGTPLEGRPTAPMFQVTRDGEPVPYRGPMVKRGAPQDKDYTTIRPGRFSRIRCQLNQNGAYDFSRPGAYTVRFKRNLTIKGETKLRELTSNTFRFEVLKNP